MEYLPNLVRQKKIIAHIFMLIVLIFTVSFATSHLLIAYHDKQKTESEIANMQSFLKEWKEKSNVINTASMRPVDPKQLDMVQTEILFNIQTNHLNLVSLKDAQKTNQINGHVFAVEFTGPYDNAIQCLQNFRAKDALIGIQHLNLEMQNGMMHVKMSYKIYTK